MALIKCAGLDGSLRNFGITKMLYDTDTGKLDIADMLLIETVKSKDKRVRASSDTYDRARSLAIGAQKFVADCDAIFAEVPTGGQSYDAVLGFGIVIGIYASLQKTIIEVSPAETKKAAVGTRTASKEEMIAWAFETYPKAKWLTTKRGGVMVPVLKNEHLADATGIVHAGILTPAFQQAAAILSASIRQAA
jgi:hypothetical protein